MCRAFNKTMHYFLFKFTRKSQNWKYSLSQSFHGIYILFPIRKGILTIKMTSPLWYHQVSFSTIVVEWWLIKFRNNLSCSLVKFLYNIIKVLHAAIWLSLFGWIEYGNNKRHFNSVRSEQPIFLMSPIIIFISSEFIFMV